MGRLVYLVIEHDDAVITAHTTKAGAEASRDKLRSDWPDVMFWVDTLKVEA